MQAVFYGLAVLACPVGMGLMMWMMMRGQKKNPDGGDSAAQGSGSQPQVDQLRAEIDQLKADRVTQRGR
jgi:hypothetical protein